MLDYLDSELLLNLAFVLVLQKARSPWCDTYIFQVIRLLGIEVGRWCDAHFG